MREHKAISARKVSLVIIIQITLLFTVLPTTRGTPSMGPKIITIPSGNYYEDNIYLYDTDVVEVVWQVVEGGGVALAINHQISEDKAVILVLEFGTKSGSVEETVTETGKYYITIHNSVFNNKTIVLFKISVERSFEVTLQSIPGYDSALTIPIICVGLCVIFVVKRKKIKFVNQ